MDFGTRDVSRGGLKGVLWLELLFEPENESLVVPTPSRDSFSFECPLTRLLALLAATEHTSTRSAGWRIRVSGLANCRQAVLTLRRFFFVNIYVYMEFVGNKAYLDSTERKRARWPSPITITGDSLAALDADIQNTVDDINEIMSGWDVITHEGNIELAVVTNILNNRTEIYRQIARHAARHLSDIFSAEVEPINNVKDLMAATRPATQ